MVRQLKKIKYKKRIITSSFLFAVIFLFLTLIIVSFSLPREEKINEKLRLPIQKEIMESIGEYTIENNEIISYINSDYQITEGQNNISINELKKYAERLKPGDIFFTSSGKYLSSVFIPGKWKHSGIYLGTKDQLEESLQNNLEIYDYFSKYYQDKNDILILDSSSEGVKIRKIEEISNLVSESYLKSFSVFRINEEQGNIQSFLIKAKNLLGKEYDYDMNIEDESYIYCSELIFHSLKEINIQINGRQKVLNREIISPNDLLYEISNNKSGKFHFVLFIKKDKGMIQELSKERLIKETKFY